MKNLNVLLLLLFFCMNFQSCDVAQQIVATSITQIQNASYYGTWKCDRTGILRAINEQGQEETGSITELYDFLKITSFKFEIHSNGVFRTHRLYTNKPYESESVNYTKNYNNNPYAILVNFNDDLITMTFSQINANSMKVELDSGDNGEFIADLNLVKVN